jgi:hypothetical protein
VVTDKRLGITVALAIENTSGKNRKDKGIEV